VFGPGTRRNPCALDLGGAPPQKRPMERFAWVCLAGALGTGTRYLIGLYANERFSHAFPWGTLIVNLAGCFLIGLVMQLAINLPSFPADLRFALTTGFLGGLTTYSSFSWETTRLFQDGFRGAAALNFTVTTLGGFGAAVLGLSLAKLLVKG
jgi:CrcB protein